MAKRPQPFVLVSTDHGTMILNRHDHHTTNDWAYGVGHQLMSFGQYDMQEIELVKFLLTEKAREGHIIALDAGANIGVHTIEWSKALGASGSILAVEAQERIYYALCGNIAINNCFNVQAINMALGAEEGTLTIPRVNYNKPASYGSLELKQHEKSEFIGQTLEGENTVKMAPIDSLDLPKCDFIKMDIEGMEMEALEGAGSTIAEHKPMMLIEYIKADKDALSRWLEGRDYDLYPFNHNFIAVHKSDKMANRIHQDGESIRIEGSE